MHKVDYPKVEEVIVKETLANGLDVVIIPRSGFQKTFAMFTTKYGSVDNWFSVGDEEAIKVPDGIAHFLEHKMFEEQEGDVFAKFASGGASVNAFTSFDRTSYLFSATDHIEQNVELLLDFVQNPYFTEENVNKEKGIIEQEINMYRDNADWRAYFGAIAALYHTHPVRIDIAGTVESIYQIDKDTLYQCYETFYHPANMVLVITGGVDPEVVLEAVRRNQAGKSFEAFKGIKRHFPAEQEGVSNKETILELPVSLAKVMLAFKEQHLPTNGEEMQRQEIVTRILLESLFGSSSPFYQQLYDEQVITDSFGADYSISEGYGFTLIGGDAPDPQLLVDRIKQELQRVQNEGLDEAIFERTKRKKIGTYLRGMNSTEWLTREYTRAHLTGTDMFGVVPIIESCTLEEVNERLKTHLTNDQMAVSIVRQPNQ